MIHVAFSACDLEKKRLSDASEKARDERKRVEDGLTKVVDGEVGAVRKARTDDELYDFVRKSGEG